MQTQTIIRYQKGQNQRLTIPSVADIVEQLEISHVWWKCKLVKPLWKTVWLYLTKAK